MGEAAVNLLARPCRGEISPFRGMVGRTIIRPYVRVVPGWDGCACAAGLRRGARPAAPTVPQVSSHGGVAASGAGSLGSVPAGTCCSALDRWTGPWTLREEMEGSNHPALPAGGCIACQPCSRLTCAQRDCVRGYLMRLTALISPGCGISPVDHPDEVAHAAGDLPSSSHGTVATMTLMRSPGVTCSSGSVKGAR